MRFRLDRVSTSSLIFTGCLLSLVPADLKFAATWRTRDIWVLERVARANYESSIAFASLALVVIGLFVVWTSYQNRMRWSWFAMLVLVLVYFIPVHLVDVFIDIGRVGWAWWPGVIHDAREGRQFAQLAIRFLATLILMVAALLVPVKDFFGRNRAATRSW